MCETECEQREPPDQMAHGHKLLSSKIPVSKLVAEEHAHDCRNRKCIKDECLLKSTKSQAWQITKDEWQP